MKYRVIYENKEGRQWRIDPDAGMTLEQAFSEAQDTAERLGEEIGWVQVEPCD